MDIMEKFNYLKGFFDGQKIEKKSKDSILLDKILSFLEDVSLKIEELEKSNSVLKCAIEDVKWEVQNISKAIECVDEDDVLNEEEIICSNCKKTIVINRNIDRIICPYCETINICNY